MMRKYGFFAALIVALLTAALVIGCIAPIDVNKGTGYTPPEGMGAFTPNFDTADQSRKTFSSDPWTIASFTGGEFKLEFTNTNNAGAGTKTVYLAYADRNDSIPLLPGTYTLDVTGYKTPSTTPGTSNDPSDPMGKVTGINVGTIAAGANTTPITITLKPIVDTTTTGTLIWTITNSITNTRTLSASSVDLTKIGTQGTDVTGGAFTGAAIASASWTNGAGLAVASGYYFIDFKLTVDSVSTINRHIVHINGNRTTHLTYEFTDDHFNFVTQGESGGGTTGTETDPTPNPTSIAVTGAITGTFDGSPGSPYEFADASTITITVTTTGLTDVQLHISKDGTMSDEAYTIGTPYTATAGAGIFADPGKYRITASGTETATTLPWDNDDEVWIQVNP